MIDDEASRPGRTQVATCLAHWLVTRLRECTIVTPVPGVANAEAWGEPDVLGLRFDTCGAPETVAVKIARSSADVPLAFVQASALKQSCHRAYLAVKDDFGSVVAQAIALCTAAGIGLITFGYVDAETPVFGLRVRAPGGAPEAFSTPEWLDRRLRLIGPIGEPDESTDRAVAA